jgi:hypothetical protein
MGWYTNYEVEFAEDIDWDNIYVTVCLKPFNVQHLYLRDLDKPRVMLCLYSQNKIGDILAALKTLYPVAMRYQIYNTGIWSEFY